MSFKDLANLANDTRELTEREKSLCRRVYCLGAFVGVLLGIVMTNMFYLLQEVR